jgi:hypothetical protein
LKSLPKTLDETYERILCNISEGYIDYAIRILRWLTFSARPLTVEEVAEVVAIHVEGDGHFDEDEVLPDPIDVITICSSLVFITEAIEEDSKSSIGISISSSSSHSKGYVTRRFREDDIIPYVGRSRSRSLNEDDATHYVRLAHYSVQEYLTSDDILLGKARSYSIQKLPSNVVIAQGCLIYLLDRRYP